VLRSGVRRAHDAGEPAGSAGAPILAAIEGAGVTDAVVVVTRWYGGTKLGVGGLVRAYGEAAAAALARRRGVPASPPCGSGSRYPYAHTPRSCGRWSARGRRIWSTATPRGARRGCPSPSRPGQVDAFTEALREGTAGAVAPERLGGAVLHRNADSWIGVLIRGPAGASPEPRAPPVPVPARRAGASHGRPGDPRRRA
jgi:hypothetical protein